MTNAQFASYCRLKTKTNSTTFTDANLQLLTNIYKDEIAGKLVDIVDEDYFGVPQFTDLVNGQREYPLPGDLPGKFKKVEAVLDPTFLDNQGNPVWVDLRKFDLTQLSALSQNLVVGDPDQGTSFSVSPTTNEDNIQQLFGNRQGSAAFMVFRNSLWIFSGALTGFVANNQYLKLWGYEWPADVNNFALTTDLSTDPNPTSAGMPRQVHLPWADRVVLAWKQTSDKNYQPDDYEAATETRLHDAIMSLIPVDKAESYTSTQPMGGQLWNNGYNL
jgi:hypothetical protein